MGSPTTTGRVVHVLDPSDSIYVGRQNPRYRLGRSRFANPFPLPRNATAEERQICIERYVAWLMTEGRANLAHLPALREKAISCWCRHDGEAKTDDNACHADALVSLLAEYTDAELIAMATTPPARRAAIEEG